MSRSSFPPLAPAASPQTPNDLLIVGFNRRVFAISRHDGSIRWRWKCPRGGLGSSFVSVLVDGDLVVASIDGYTYGLDAGSGQQRWSQLFSGEGTGITSLASMRGGSSGSSSAHAAIAAAQAAAAAAATAAGAGASAAS